MAADYKIKYATPVDLTITLASLATSSTRVAGRESTAVDNGTNLYVDALVAGKFTVGTTPTISTFIDVWIYAARDETPTYPTLVTTGITGSDAGATAATEGIRSNAMRLGATVLVDATTSDRGYDFAPFSVAALYGGVLPRRWGVFVTHNTGVNLNSTGGNHKITYTGIHGQSV
jgi:hypothetical protein